MFAKLFISTKRSSKVERAPRFHLAHCALVIVVVMFGVASTLGALATVDRFGLSETQETALMIVAGVLTFSVAIIPILLAPAWAIAEGNMKFAGLILIALMMAPDVGLQTNAVMETEAKLRAPLVQQLEQRLSSLEVSGTEQATLNSVRYELREARKPRLSQILIAAVMIGFQIGTFFLRAWLTHVTVTKDEELLEKRRKARQPKRKQPKLHAVA